jgi:Uma2 family endonuclease
MRTIKPMSRSAPLMTAKQFARRRDFIGELWDGIPQAGGPSSIWASVVGTRIVTRLADYVSSRRLGWVGGAGAGFHVRRNPDRVLSPDGAFVAAPRMTKPPGDCFIPLVPDFILEVRSSDESWLDTVKRGGIWLGHEVSLVWCVDPTRRRVAVLRQEAPVQIVGLGGVLRADPVLPRFRLPVEDLFRNPG